jgi:hypothetical protein
MALQYHSVNLTFLFVCWTVGTFSMLTSLQFSHLYNICYFHRLETSASSLAETIQQGELPAKASVIAPTILEVNPKI